MAQQLPNYGAYDFFIYEVDFLALAPGASQTNNFTVQQEADFLLTKITMIAVNTNLPQTPLCTIMINDTGSGRNLMSSNVPLSSMFGDGQLPFILPRQRLFVASSVVNITLTSFDTTDTYSSIRLTFVGEKAFRM
jgi:hypothetical protein